LTETTENLQQTPLYDRHVALGARLVPFAGWMMPVQYKGIIHEHRLVREKAGLFDLGHMGEIEVTGPDALALLSIPVHQRRFQDRSRTRAIRFADERKRWSRR